MNYKTLTKAGLFCALITIATMLIKLPIPQTQGYVNFGDGFIFLGAMFLINPYCALAAAVGSALADMFLGAGIYIIPTFIIKGLMGYIAAKAIYGNGNSNKKIAIGVILAEIIMVLGYFLFEIFAYGFSAAAASVPFNAMQAAAGIIVGFVLIKFADKLKLQEKF